MVTENSEKFNLIGIEDEMKTSYLDYAMSVIVARALPDVRDGMKPVHRRILYSMYDSGMRSNSSYKKSARVVGDVLGKYHPHGDGAVYDAMVRMAQPFNMRYTIVDGQGNFGSVDGDPPAAMRYTESKLAPIADMILADIDKDTVEWADNFDASLQEPTTLPTILPTLLVNGAAGIAVGMATNMAPHNLSEVCDGLIALIDNPDSTIEDLMEFIKAPDFPTGAHIWGLEGVKSAYATGKGRVMMQANHKIEEGKNEKQSIIFNQIPYQVNKANLVIRIAELIKTKKIEGISEVRDESDRKGTRVVIELKRGITPAVVLNNLYKNTPLRSSFSINMLALVDGTPRVLNLKQVLKHFIDFRVEIITNRSKYELNKAQNRIHILEGLKIALDNIDKVIEIIRASNTVEEARNSLIKSFDLSDVQAQSIVDMQLRRLTGLEREKLDNEYNDLLKMISELESLLNDPDKILEEIKNETLGLKEKYGDKRKTKIHKQELGEWNREDVEPHEEMVVTLSLNGYLKRVSTDSFKRQHRGGKGVKGQRMTQEEDVTPYLQVCDTHDSLLFFTDRGRVFSTRVFDLPANQSRTSRGAPVANIISLEPREKVNAILAVPKLDQKIKSYIVLSTRTGLIKRMEVSQLKNLRKSGLNAFKLKNDDELVSVRLAIPDNTSEESLYPDVIMVTEMGQAIRFPLEEIKSRLRNAGGVRGINLKKGDKVVVMDLARPEDSLLIASQKGFGKLSDMRYYTRQRRGGKGNLTLRITPKNGKVASAQVVGQESDVYLLTEKAVVQEIPLGEISRYGRVTQGSTLMKLNARDKIASIRAVSPLKVEQPKK
ncbi:MAG: DNA gyrase subunit A [Dehalococcoidia bacterium]|nr:DNA gyrase subunit A [Dehalococcoidia bacterium]